jgi:hypothetical protein
LSEIATPAWIAASNDHDALRRVAKRAQEQGHINVAKAALARLCQLEGLDHNDPVAREIWEGVAALEEIRSMINGKRTRSEYTRRKLRNKGAIQSVEEWAHDGKETTGFSLLTEHGFVDKTAEYIVLRYPQRFSEKAITASKKKLNEHGIPFPDPVP